MALTNLTVGRAFLLFVAYHEPCGRISKLVPCHKSFDRLNFRWFCSLKASPQTRSLSENWGRSEGKPIRAPTVGYAIDSKVNKYPLRHANFIGATINYLFSLNKVYCSKSCAKFYNYCYLLSFCFLVTSFSVHIGWLTIISDKEQVLRWGGKMVGFATEKNPDEHQTMLINET